MSKTPAATVGTGTTRVGKTRPDTLARLLLADFAAGRIVHDPAFAAGNAHDADREGNAHE